MSVHEKAGLGSLKLPGHDRFFSRGRVVDDDGSSRMGKTNANNAQAVCE